MDDNDKTKDNVKARQDVKEYCKRRELELVSDVNGKMEKNIVVTLCKLEKILPPGFFDHMENLVVHLSYEARVGGPVQYRWMYPFE
nr:hypothetical protein [Tanacetum cinerariifolium]